VKRPFRVWTISFACCVVLVLIGIRYLDHPIADFLELHFRHTKGWIVLNAALDPLKVIVLAALLSLFGAGGMLIAAKPLPSWTHKPLICAVASMWALATEFVFKQIFGRAWPEPTYIRDHLDGFRFLHATYGWTAFPSGHALNSFAIAAVVWQLVPRWRVPVMTLAVVVSAGMVACNYHWLSDVLAGAFLGVTIGWMTVLFTAVSVPDAKYPNENRPDIYNPSATSSNRAG